jgi:putative transposase
VSSRPRAKENSREESRFTEAKIVSILKELEAGTSATELGRRHGVHPNTIGNWKQKYSGLETSDLTRLKQLEVEHAQMSRIIARQALELEAVRDLISKNGWGPRSGKKQ